MDIERKDDMKLQVPAAPRKTLKGFSWLPSRDSVHRFCSIYYVTHFQSVKYILYLCINITFFHSNKIDIRMTLSSILMKQIIRNYRDLMMVVLLWKGFLLK